MSKLFTLKDWLKLPEAAQYLSIQFGEDVSVADVLRLGLDGHLRLSVDFVNHTHAKGGPVIGIEEVTFMKPPLFAKKMIDSLPIPEAKKKHALEVAIPDALPLDSVRYVKLGKEIVSLRGVWNLPMPPLGGERLDLEHEYQQLTGGPAVTLTNFNGTFVEGKDGQMWQLQESWDNNEFHSGSKAEREAIELKIAASELPDEDAKTRLEQHKKDRKKYMDEKFTKPGYNDYYPAGGLPQDSVFVVRTEALKEFELSLTNGNADTERSTAQKGIAPQSGVYRLLKAMVDLNYGKEMLEDLQQARSKRLSEIKADLEAKGYSFDDTTLRKHLKNLPD
jgi:hypothetical protein